MKTILLTAAIAIVATSASAWPITKPAWVANPNYGKADDYGSERFATINRCMTQNITAAAEGRDKVSIELCMSDHGFVFCPDCKIFGNKGPACLDEDHLHSWCWKKED